MQNKDWKLIYNSLINNSIKLYMWDSEWIDEIKDYDYLELEHLWPDLIWISKEKIYWIEHFYVDASKKNRKWNELRAEYSKVIKWNNIPKIEKDLEKENISSNSHKFKSSLNYENLKNNTYSNFEEHYKKIKSYNQNIQEKYWIEKDIEIIFFIEYNILPSMYLINWKFERYFFPFNDINFLTYFSNKKEISWIIFSVDNENYYIPIKDNYIIDNVNIFDFSRWEIEDFVEMNQITVWIRINKF